MAIYIQSRGKNQDRDYRWLRIKAEEYYPENPKFLMQPIVNLSLKPVDLVESQKFSVILVARKDDYCLLVTGLKAREERLDFAGRSLRNSLLWICPREDNEPKVRSLLIRALQGKLQRELDQTITTTGQYGFEVDYQSLVEFFDSPLNLENNQNTDFGCKIAHNSEALRQEMVLELQANPLPHQKGLLVVVTSIKSASALKATGVWRGLSNRIKDEQFVQYSSLTASKQTQKKTIFLVIAIALILSIAIALVIIKYTNLEKPQPEVIPTPSTIQKNLPDISKLESNPSVKPSKTNEISYLRS